MTKEETTWGKDFAELIFNLNTKDIDGTNNYISLSQETELKQFISKLISQEKEKWVEEMVEKFQMEGEYGKLTPFQQTVNTYIKNRGEEIKKDLIQK